MKQLLSRKRSLTQRNKEIHTDEESPLSEDNTQQKNEKKYFNLFSWRSTVSMGCPSICGKTFTSRKKHMKRVAIFILILYLINLKIRLFGWRSLNGGLIGIGVDKYLKDKLVEQSEAEWVPFQVTTGKDPRKYAERFYDLDKESTLCHSLLCHVSENVVAAEDDDEIITLMKKRKDAFPKYVIQAPTDLYQAVVDSFVDSNALGKHLEQGWKRIHFTDAHMRRVLRDAIPSKPLIPLYSALSTSQQKILFSIVAIYSYGGLFLSDLLAKEPFDVTPLLIPNTKTEDCHESKAFVLRSSDKISLDPSFLLATPRHPALFETIMKLPDVEIPYFITNIFNRTYFQNLLSINIEEYNLKNQKDSNIEYLSQTCHRCNKNICCTIFKDKHSILNFTHPSPPSSTPIPVYFYQETPYLAPITDAKKTPLQLMKDRWCEPPWLCNRCLKYAGLGTYTKCSNVCSQCVMDIMCSPPPPRKHTPIAMYVNQTMLNLKKRYIPKIIHQTWFEKLTVEKYPNMIRLQNSWRATGWEYRFYDDEAARKFILEHYPPFFVSAYDSLVPGAFKADLFRYLVLLISGGVYADIDLMLSTTIDTLITPEVSFITARDTPGSEANEPYCLWNGFIASQPGHPFLIQAIQRSVNFIRDRATIFDMERSLCVSQGRDIESWKIRTEQGLVLTGPCALGIAVNEALNEYPLRKFPLGLMRYYHTPNYAINGETHILLLRKEDLGSLRLTDVERNVIVATTDIPEMSKFPSVESQPDSDLYLATSSDCEKGNSCKKKVKKHYSYAGRGDWEWGSKFVYKDNIVTDDLLDIQIHYI